MSHARSRRAAGRPRARLRRDRRWIITRLWASTLATLAIVGWTRPDMLHREYVDGEPLPRVVVDR